MVPNAVLVEKQQLLCALYPERHLRVVQSPRGSLTAAIFVKQLRKSHCLQVCDLDPTSRYSAKEGYFLVDDLLCLWGEFSLDDQVPGLSPASQLSGERSTV